MSQTLSLRCSIVRGGTSKAIFIMENELPAEPAAREKVLLALYGSPDIRQIDGLGGADLLTSKLAIIGPPSRAGTDVDYTFGQVSLDKPFVEFNSNCGNISSAVGVYAIDKGLVRPVEPVTVVFIHLTNVGRVMVAEIPVVNGKPAVDGDFAIDGVPGAGPRIALDWSDVVGGTTGRLLPTGRVADTVDLEGRACTLSVVDAGTLSAFVRAAEVGMTGLETPREIEARFLPVLEKVRGKAAELAGLVSDYRRSLDEVPYLPFLCVVAEAADYTCFNGAAVRKEDIDLVARLYNMGLVNKTYAGSGTVATGVAARLPGSVVHGLLTPAARSRNTLHIGHAAGRIPVEAAVRPDAAGQWQVDTARIFRTARILMDGTAYVRRSVLS